MGLMRSFSFVSVVCALSLVSWTQARADCKPKKSEPVVIEVVAPDGVLTLADGRALRLAALAPPADKVEWAAWAGVLTNIKPPQLKLYLSDKPTDRYGQVQGLLARGDGQLIEAALVSAGLARVSPRSDMRLCLAELLALEDEARVARRGLWAEAANLPLQASDIAGLEAREGKFTLVEGVVTDAVNRSGRLYLNFGVDWRTDFTVTVGPGDVRLFSDQRLRDLKKKEKTGKPAGMKGVRVRVRGFIERYNGPDMILTTPEQLEFLGPAGKTGRTHDVK